MSLLGRLVSPVRGIWYLRRMHAELRGIRRALERQAAVMELQALPAGSTERAQTFRSTTMTKEPLSTRDLHEASGVSYVDAAKQATYMDKEEELTALLGRLPTEAEMERAIEGIEV